MDCWRNEHVGRTLARPVRWVAWGWARISAQIAFSARGRTVIKAHDPFGLTAGRVPVELADQTYRVRLIKLFADAVLAGEEPPREACLFVASALSAFLQEGGRLDRFLGVRAKPGSHTTPQAIARLLDQEHRE